MITAEEARGLHPDRLAEHDLEVIEEQIREAASKGRPSIRAPQNMICGKGYNLQFRCPSVSTTLRNWGFSVAVKSEDGMLADIWIEIRWACDHHPDEAYHVEKSGA